MEPIFKFKHHLVLQSFPPEYSLKNHEQHESEDIPLAQNLSWTQNSLKQETFKFLYTSSLDNGPNEEFMRHFVIYIAMLLLSGLIHYITRLVILTEANKNAGVFIFHSVCISLILLSSVVLPVMMFRNETVFAHHRALVLLLVMVFLTYLVIGDDRVLYPLVGESIPENYPNNTLFVLLLLYSLPEITFYSFRCQVILSIYTLLIYFSVFMLTGHPDPYILWTDYLLLCLALLKHVSDCFSVDYRKKQLFWRLHKEKTANAVKEVNSNNILQKNPLKSTLENLLDSCVSVKRNLKQLLRVFISTKLKRKLEKSLKDMRQVMKNIPSLIKKENFQISYHLAEEEKTFINENFIEPPSVHSTLSATTMQQLDIHKLLYEVPSSDYPLAILSKFGRDWAFDVFFLEKLSTKTIPLLASYLSGLFNIEKTLNVNPMIFTNFFEQLGEKYINNPYHYSSHACDVAHSLLYFILNSRMHQYTSMLELIALSIAALSHDVGHKGVTNRFLVHSKDDLAYQYNDTSVQENMHSAILFSISKSQSADIFSGISSEDYSYIRKMIIELILSTDMSKHFEILGLFRARAVILRDLSIQHIEDKMCLYSVALKSADLGHSAKPLELHQIWTFKVVEELFMQGDLEKQAGMPVSMYCDRDTTVISCSQYSFLKNICCPLLSTFIDFLKSETLKSVCMQHLKENKKHWKNGAGSRRVTHVTKKEAFKLVDRTYTMFYAQGSPLVSKSSQI